MRAGRQSLSASGRLWWMTALLLVAAAVRLMPLVANRFHPDEALFAALARLIVSGRDPLLSTTSLLVDKPPLFYYLLAGSMALTGGSELAARLPGFFASLVSVTLVARLAWQLWRSRLSVSLVMALTALSPFAILFAPTAFSDPLLVMWFLAALVAVSTSRWGWGGFLFGLAVATKQNALFFAPLVLALGVVQSIDADFHWSGAWRWSWRFAVTFGLVLALVFLWDAARQGAVSFWSAGAQINNPGRLARSREVWPRAAEWLSWFHYLTALDGLNWLLVALLIALAPLEIVRRARTRGAANSLVILAFLLGYLGLQWLVAFPVLDRYLLPLVPLIALLAGRAVSLLIDALSLPHRLTCWLLPSMLAAAMIWPAWQAARSAYPVGGDHGAFDGIDQAADYLRGQPVGTVVYYHTLGWELDYYLFDAYIYPSWYDSPVSLTRDLSAFGRDGTPRFLILSKIESQLEALNAVLSAGCEAVPVLEPADRTGSRSIVVYHLACDAP